MERISPFLEHGEGIWWLEVEDGYEFFDSDSDPEHKSHGLDLMHLCTSTIQDVYMLSQETWRSITDKKTRPSRPLHKTFQRWYV